jgi:hypothetical protein
MERLGDKRCSTVLNQLQKLPYLKNQILTDVINEDFVKDRMAFLELSIARAMIRCGLKDGIPILINYLDDVRASLRENAYEWLVNYTGMDFKLDVEEWTRWFTQSDTTLTPMPDMSLTDAQKQW